MGRQLNKYEWLKVFNLYEQYNNYDITKKEFISKYIRITKKNITNWDNVLHLIKTKFNNYNLGMNIESQTGKAPKKGKNVGRRKKNKKDDELRQKLQDEALSKLSKDDLKNLISNIYYEIILDKYKSKNLDEVIKKIKKTISNNLTNVEIMNVLGIKKSTFYYKLKNKNNVKVEKIKYEEEIVKAFEENKNRFGRERLSIFLKKNNNISINPRTLGRYMQKLGLYCSIRQAKRKREIKNTNVKFLNIANRDYDGKINDIYATDVTYIPAPKDVRENHVYLSVLIHHKTKKIVSWNLSKNNDVSLVMSHITKTKFPVNFVIHSDHGSQYSSSDYITFIQQRNGIVSMSRIGNSLDNREIEYFFSILKTEIFPIFQQKVRTLTFGELREKIDQFINWYNNERFIKKFNLKTPHELWEVYTKQINWV